MFALTKLWQAVAALAANIATLAETVGTINDSLRQRIGLDGAAPPELPSLAPPDGTAAPPEGNGHGRRGKKQTA